MSTSYAALCSSFYVDMKLGVRMDLPARRDTILDFFERIRKERPKLDRFRRYRAEFALESPQSAGQQEWVAIRKTEIRSGYTDPTALTDAYALHRLVLSLSPFYLTINPLDVECVELVFGFELDASANHNQIVAEALLDGSPLAAMLDDHAWKPVDVQPIVAMTLADRPDLRAQVEVKTRTGSKEIRADRYREEPIAAQLILRRSLNLRDVTHLPDVLSDLARIGEKLVEDKMMPCVIQPLRQAIASSNAS